VKRANGFLLGASHVWDSKLLREGKYIKGTDSSSNQSQEARNKAAQKRHICANRREGETTGGESAIEGISRMGKSGTSAPGGRRCIQHTFGGTEKPGT